jgi:hypothetical protein
MSPQVVVAWADSDAEPTGEDWAQVETTHIFVPVGFEARTGAFGPRMWTFLREVAEVADVASSSDLYHWCAMVCGERWEHRLGVKLAQGEANLVLGAEASARANVEASGLRPTASHASASKGELASPNVSHAHPLKGIVWFCLPD